MSRKPKRGLTIFDLMLLIASLGVAFTGYEAFKTVSESSGWGPGHYYRRYGSFAIALAASALVSSLIPPRRPLRRLFRHPGVATCLTLTLCTLGSTLLGYGEQTMRVVIYRGWPPGRWSISPAPFYVHACIFPLPGHLGFVVAATWITLAATGRWRWSGGGSIGFLGLGLGVYWILATVKAATGF